MPASIFLRCMPNLESILLLPPDVTFQWRVNKQAKRITLRLSTAKRIIILVTPPTVSTKQAQTLLIQRADWLQHILTQLPEPVALIDGQIIPFLGQPLRIHHHLIAPVANMAKQNTPNQNTPNQNTPNHRHKPHHQDHIVETVWVEFPHRLHFAGPDTAISAAIIFWMARQAFALFSDLSLEKARRLGANRPLTRIAIRDPSTRWGSCSPTGRLAYSWRLIMAPLTVIDYIVAHEVAHLAELNHSARFWGWVDQLTVNRAFAESWLRTKGSDLHRYGTKIALNISGTPLPSASDSLWSKIQIQDRIFLGENNKKFHTE